MLRQKEKRNIPEEAESVTAIKKKKAVLDEGIDEDGLEKLVFGGDSDLFATLDPTIEQEESSSDESEGEGHGEVQVLVHTVSHVDDQPLAAWVDDDDETESIDVTAEAKLRKLRDTREETILKGKKYSQKLRSQFEKIYGDGSWASLDKKPAKASDSDEEEEEDMLQRTGNYLASRSERLAQGLLNIKRVKDANSAKPSNVTLQSLEFHPSAKVLLTAGLNKTLDLFQIDGRDNPKLQSVFIKKFPINAAHFTTDGEQVIMTSRRRFFYVYDMIKGQVTKIPGIRGRGERNLEKFKVSPDGQHLLFVGDDGYMIMLSSRTKQWVDNLKMNGSVKDFSFSVDGSRMYSTGSDGEVYVWDMNTRNCVHKFVDDGCLTGTTVAASRDGSYIACGSDSGVVNIYDSQCLYNSRPKPVKSITNLLTPITGTAFNSTSEIMAISSRTTKNAFKLVHIPSFTVFSNWPSNKAPLRYVNAFDFSPNSGFLSVGNDRGTALLYRLNHYTDS